jgi:hypothetical protein
MSIEMDFRKDFSLLLKESLRSFGIYLEPSISLDEIPYIYFNYIKRKIYPKPRDIVRVNSFSCPQELSDGLKNLENKIKNGQDLTPHLSKLVLNNYKSRDYMLNDWGIYHLHLGINITNGFVDRTDPVLFCMVTDDVIYFIAMKHHGDWTDQSLLSTVYSNWPELLRPFILKGVVASNYHPTNDEIEKLRKGNVSLLFELEPGIVIIPPGGGYMTDGTSMEVVMKRDNTMRMLSYFEDKIRSNEKNIRKQIISQNKTPARQLKLKLNFNGNEPIAYEIYSKMYFS